MKEVEDGGIWIWIWEFIYLLGFGFGLEYNGARAEIHPR
jgi:hypothetical protein